VSEPETLAIEVNGFQTRVWRKGSGPKLGFLAGFGGLPRWIPFLDELARTHAVIVPSLPGFPGGDRGHSVLDSHLDWLLAVREILDKTDLAGADLAGSSVGASLAAEVAALWPASVRKLALIAPFGLFDETNPPTDPWAQRADALPGLMCADPAVWTALKARIFWPLGNTRIEKRLRLIKAPTLLLWGDQDKVIPRAYAEIFATGIGGATATQIIEGAGHLAELDKPVEVARAISSFFSGG